MTPTQSYALEPLTTELFSELCPLLEKHHEELKHFNDIPLEPDVSFYEMAQKAGILKVFTNRIDGKLIGYAVFFVKSHPHSANSVQASGDIIFIDPDHRGMGKAFVGWCDEQLKGLGVQVVYQHVKNSHNWGKLLERIGYSLVDLTFAKRLA